jgi:hypothetical protein
MAREPRLLDQIESIAFAPDSFDLFAALTSYSAADEEAAVVLVAAAVLLAREHLNPGDVGPLSDLTDQFRDVVFEARRRLTDGRCRPTLRVVGGTEHNPSRKEA